MVFGGVALYLTQINANYDKDVPKEDQDETGNINKYIKWNV